MDANSHLWALLLAAGDGNRVRSLMRAGDGACAPKQFCTVDGRRSLLCRTIDRAAALVPPHRIVTVVADRHRRWWEEELSHVPPENVVVQPENRGTAAGILLPLLSIVRRDGGATIVVLPSDHHVESEEVLRETILDAVRAVERDATRVVLLGMPPREWDTDYGWIVPEAEHRGPCGVTAFVEKPDGEGARFLLGRGALLNSLILVATGQALLGLFDRAMPQLVGRFVSWIEETGAGAEALGELYRDLSPRDFSRSVLERWYDALSVIRTPDCGWTDVGTPSRLGRVRSRRSTRGVGDARLVCRA